jgi:predicted dehydrogenase
LRKKLNIGWIGSGFVGQVAHLRNFYLNKNVNISAISELRPNLAKKVQKKYNIPKFYNDYKKMISENNFDAVVAIVRRYNTANVAKEVLGLNQNLFTEKPMAPSFKLANELVNLSKKKKLVYVIGNMRRFDPGINKAKNLFDKYIKNKKLGNLTNFRFYCHAGNDYCNVDGDIKTNEKPPTTPTSDLFPKWINSFKEGKQFEKFLNYFSHDINLIRYFFGNNINVQYATKNKSTGNVHFNTPKVNGNFEFSYLDSKYWSEGFEIYFTKGMISVELPPAFLVNQPSKISISNYAKNKLTNIKSDWLWSFKMQADNFVDTILNNKKNICSGEDTINDLSLIEKIWKKF